LNYNVFIAFTLACTSVSKKRQTFLTNTIERFSFAVPSTAKEKGINLCALCASAVN